MTFTGINPHLPLEVLNESGESGSRDVVIALANKTFQADNRATEESRNSGTGNRSGA